MTDKQKENLEKFESDNTVTITTGHQLNLFTGPLYFFYKILQTIKCCEYMQKLHPEINFVPIFGWQLKTMTSKKSIISTLRIKIYLEQRIW